MPSMNCFAQHVGVVARGQPHGVLHLRIAEHLGDADRRAFARRLHDQRQSEVVGHGAHMRQRLLIGIQALPARRRQTLGQPHAFGHHLVERDRRGHHAGAGVRDAEQFERALHRAVFAVAAVQRDEAAHEAVALEFDEIALARVEGVRVDADRSQRGQHAVARQQRDLALGRRAAHQHRGLAERARVDRLGLVLAVLHGGSWCTLGPAAPSPADSPLGAAGLMIRLPSAVRRAARAPRRSSRRPSRSPRRRRAPAR